MAPQTVLMMQPAKIGMATMTPPVGSFDAWSAAALFHNLSFCESDTQFESNTTMADSRGKHRPTFSALSGGRAGWHKKFRYLGN